MSLQLRLVSRARVAIVGLLCLALLGAGAGTAALASSPAQAKAGSPRSRSHLTSTASPTRPGQPPRSVPWPFARPDATFGSVTAGHPGLSYAARRATRRYVASPPPPMRAITLAPPKGTSPSLAGLRTTTSGRTTSITSSFSSPSVSSPLVQSHLALPPSGSTFAAPSAEYVDETTAPAKRGWASITYDSGHGTDVLFGGTSGYTGADLNDTWTWDGTSWTQPSPTTSPPLLSATRSERGAA